MELSQVLRKLEIAAKKAKREYAAELRQELRNLKRDPKCEHTSKRVAKITELLESNSLSIVPGIPYRPRLKDFRGHMTSTSGRFSGGPKDTVSCSFDYETGEARSFEWYIMGRYINGHYIVNSYRYSSATSGHVSDLIKTLGILGIKYRELEAPQGLQDLDASKSHLVGSLAKEIVASKYAKKYSRKSAIRFFKNQLKTLKFLGISTAEKEISRAVESAEFVRQDRNKRARERSKVSRAIKKKREAEQLAKAQAKLTELKKSKYVGGEVFMSSIWKRKFIVVKSETLTTDSEHLHEFEAVPGNNVKECIKFLKVCKLLGVKHAI